MTQREEERWVIESGHVALKSKPKKRQAAERRVLPYILAAGLVLVLIGMAATYLKF